MFGKFFFLFGITIAVIIPNYMAQGTTVNMGMSVMSNQMNMMHPTQACCSFTQLVGVNIQGSMTFIQPDPNGPTTVQATVTGLSPLSIHGIHIHQNGNLSDSCNGAGPHFNPMNMTHGAPTDAIRHVGDMGNILADKNGVGILNYVDNFISLSGDHSIIGRACVIHQDPDDLGKGSFNDSLTTGHAGKRIACGIVQTCQYYKLQKRFTISYLYHINGFFVWYFKEILAIIIRIRVSINYE